MRKFLAAIALISAAFSSPAQVKSRGVPNAPILLEIYSDFQCPACKAMYEGTLRELFTDYVAKGKVYVIHHDFPLPMHSHAMEAACYANAAERVGKYEQVSDVLFREQEKWAATGNVDQTVCSVLTPEEARKVRALAKDPSIIAEVEADVQAGHAIHVNSTPTVILTHKLKQYPVPSGVSYDTLRRFIDQLLAN